MCQGWDNDVRGPTEPHLFLCPPGISQDWLLPQSLKCVPVFPSWSLYSWGMTLPLAQGKACFPLPLLTGSHGKDKAAGWLVITVSVSARKCWEHPSTLSPTFTTPLVSCHVHYELASLGASCLPGLALLALTHMFPASSPISTRLLLKSQHVSCLGLQSPIWRGPQKFFTLQRTQLPSQRWKAVVLIRRYSLMQYG